MKRTTTSICVVGLLALMAAIHNEQYRQSVIADDAVLDPVADPPGTRIIQSYVAPQTEPIGIGRMGAPGGRGGLALQHRGPMRNVLVTRTVHEMVQQPIPPEELEEANQFRAAVKKLKESDNDDPGKKELLTKDVRQLLLKQFERDLNQRERELAAVEERVKTLRKQLDKRKSAKDDIIQLRLNTIVYDAEGLGFPGEDGFGDAIQTSDAANPYGVSVPVGNRRKLELKELHPNAPATYDNSSQDPFAKPRAKPRANPSPDSAPNG